ncbi:hypothetical protein DCO44_16115 [Acinetobacter sp. AM]|uniref:hypothetical protein n=1 Tax=Acinetobacter sp. AM TaxID=2170730 RepID=UPI000DE684BA|nr:hypothetical protein [Acinetobacter sp. AM]PWB13045.1 hypothetical protein DCO44_16115 [Acinetobacter sp. AM]
MLKFLLAGCVCLFPVWGHAKPQAQILKPQKITQAQRESICSQLKISCNSDATWQLYQVPNQPKHHYVIAKLKLFELEKNAQSYQLRNHWDFSDYRPLTQNPHWTVDGPVAPEDLLDENGKFVRADALHLYPVLFPVNDTDYSIALIQRWDEMYSGGGMTEEAADFLQLNPQGKYQQIFQNIPFSVSRMIRACFSEQDYAQSGEHCHDLEKLVLNIEYLQANTWRMKYHYIRTLSPSSDQLPMNQRKTYVLNANKADAIQFPSAWTEY